VLGLSKPWLTLIGREIDRINTLNVAPVFKGLKTVTSDSPCIPGVTPCTFSQGPRMLVALKTLPVLQKLPCTKQPQWLQLRTVLHRQRSVLQNLLHKPSSRYRQYITGLPLPGDFRMNLNIVKFVNEEGKFIQVEGALVTLPPGRPQRQKTTGFMSKTTVLHDVHRAFWYISLTYIHSTTTT